MSEENWRRVAWFYRDTVGKKGGRPYLTDGFFELAGSRLGCHALCMLAQSQGEVVATSLFFQRGSHLYGRYWGGLEGFTDLHFEMCYHKPIELCIDNGWQRFEAGAQGLHKLKRGLMPAATHSVHWLRHPGLSQAVSEAVARERDHVESEMMALANHGPFHRVEC